MLGLLKITLIRLLSLARIKDSKTIYFEGGLGAQIFSYLEYLDKCDGFIGEQTAVKCDFSYFDQASGFKKDGLRIGPWLLNCYGIEKASLESKAKQNSAIHRKLRAGVVDKSLQDRLDNIQTLAKRYQDRFKTTLDVHYFAQKRIGLKESDYDLAHGVYQCCAIHIRRGDYLQVASHIVSDSDYFNLIMKIKTLIPKNVVLFSDSVMEPSQKERWEEVLKGKNVFFCLGNEYEEIEVHNFMRKVRVLVTGNSVFSLSAGLLSKNETLVFSPINFYHSSPDNKSFNPYIGFGKFLLLD
jgi:hypothetical protein